MRERQHRASALQRSRERSQLPDALTPQRRTVRQSHFETRATPRQCHLGKTSSAHARALPPSFRPLAAFSSRCTQLHSVADLIPTPYLR